MARSEKSKLMGSIHHYTSTSDIYLTSGCRRRRVLRGILGVLQRLVWNFMEYGAAYVPTVKYILKKVEGIVLHLPTLQCGHEA
jgi:hypothetical protein